jgi:hypothetical protein
LEVKLQTPDFIMHKQGIFTREYCNKVIEEFDKAEKVGNVIDRQANGEGNTLRKNDLAYYPFQETAGDGLEIVGDFNQVFWGQIYPEYANLYAILDDFDKHHIWHHKVQKTNPCEGYHIWHTENMNRQSANRVLTYMLYLNDVDDGGETEFLYYAKRFKPRAGDFLLWPAGFTHTHRGNPPLSNTKYVMTGWVEF